MLPDDKGGLVLTLDLHLTVLGAITQLTISAA
jgi:hypothetical protein